MTNKRFKLDFDNCREGCIMDREDKYGQYKRLYDFGKVGRHQIVALMNALHEENEQLRQLYKVYEKAEEVEEKAKDCLIQELKEENEQLRVLLKEAEDEIQTLKQNNKGLMESLVEHESED